MSKQTQQLILMLIIGILIGTAVAKVFSVKRAEAPVTASTPSKTDEQSAAGQPPTGQVLSSSKEFPLPPSVPQNSRVGITVADQSAGKTVTVSGIKVAEVSWIAIYEDKEGRPGSILGAQKVNPGDSSALVELLRPEGTLAGYKYYAAVLTDNGDGQFDRLTDLPPFSPDKVIIVSFKAQ